MERANRAKKKMLALVLVFAASVSILCTNTWEAKAMSSSSAGGNKIYKSGSFQVKIKDAEHADSNLKITVSRDTLPSWSTMTDKSTKWNIALSGTNNHSAVLTSKTSSTKRDINGEYFVLNIGLKYTLPAHDKYVSKSVESTRVPDCRMNFENYAQDGSGSNTAANATHSTGAKTVTINLQVNTACASVRTHEQRRYTGCVMSFEIARPSYTLNTKHWAQGFSKGDLNASLVTTNPASVSATRNSLVLRQSAASAAYKCCTSVNPGNFAIAAPKGYQLSDKMYTNAINGTAGTYPLGSINMGTANRTVSLYHGPVNYTISYNLNGGTNNASNPKTYTICYPVSFAAPTKAGSKFLGWYEGNTKVTGINQGINNSGLTTANFYTQMNARTTGNKSITAKWDDPPVITSPVVNNQDGNKVAPFLKTIDGKEMLIIQKGDKFTAEKYQTAADELDGDLTAKTQVVKNVPLENGCATKSGQYEVTYQAADSSGLKASKTINVLVNDPPKPVTLPRYYYKGDSATKENLLQQVTIDDQEDGKTKAASSKVVTIKEKSTDKDTGKTDLDTSKQGEYKVTCLVEDSLKGTAAGDFTAYVKEDIQETNAKTERYPRFIDGVSIPLLGADSIWMTDPDYYGSLASSLQSNTPMKRYDLF